MSVPMVSFQNLSHKYAKQWAIQSIDFNIEKKGVYGLLGSNGAGKSTIMNITCGVLYPTEGDVLIEGRSIRDAPLEAKERIGFLPQQAPVYPEFTVDEYLVYCAQLRRVPKTNIRTVVEAAKDRVGVSHFSKRLIGALSGGYRQRVGIAQAILHSPGLVVLDEPTNGLDPNQILEVRNLIKQIARDCTVLLSTHILPEVEAMCDEIRMIDEGKIVFEGSMEAFSNVVQPSRLIVVFAETPDLDVLGELQGITSVDKIRANRLRIHVDPGIEIAAAVIATSSQYGWGLREIYRERSSLEDVFARLSRHIRTT